MIGFIIGATFDVIGKVLIGIAVVMVYGHLIRERKLDRDSLKAMKREQILTIVGINFIIVGYFIQLLIML